LESEAVKDEHDEYQLIRRHLRKMNRHPLWSQAHKIFVPENNYGMEATHLESLVKEYQDVTTYWQKNHPGVVKTHESTNDMQKMMVSCLFNRRLGFETDLFTESRKMNQEKILALCKEQFGQFHWDKKPAKDVHSKDRWAMSGKIGSKQDDLLIAVLMAYKYGLNIMNNPRHDVFVNVPDNVVRRVAQVERITIET
jgi:hypothetical protein